jgi:hypothetical protein
MLFNFLALTLLQEDDSKVTMSELGNTVTSVFGTTFEFHNFFVNALSAVRPIPAVSDDHLILMLAFSGDWRITSKKLTRAMSATGPR